MLNLFSCYPIKMEINIINKSVNIQFPEDVLGVQFFVRLIIVVLSLSDFGELVGVI